MDWFDSLIPSGLWSRGVEEMHEDFNGAVPWLTEIILLFILVFIILLAVSVDSMVIKRATEMVR